VRHSAFQGVWLRLNRIALSHKESGIILPKRVSEKPLHERRSENPNAALSRPEISKPLLASPSRSDGLGRYPLSDIRIAVPPAVPDPSYPKSRRITPASWQQQASVREDRLLLRMRYAFPARPFHTYPESFPYLTAPFHTTGCSTQNRLHTSRSSHFFHREDAFSSFSFGMPLHIELEKYRAYV